MLRDIEVIDLAREAREPGVSHERWRRLTLDEQIGNLGVDVSRAIDASLAGDRERMEQWLAVARSEFALTLGDPRWPSTELAEIEQMHALAEDFFGENGSGSTPATFEAWWMPRAIRANEARSSRPTGRRSPLSRRSER